MGPQSEVLQICLLEHTLCNISFITLNRGNKHLFLIHLLCRGSHRASSGLFLSRTERGEGHSREACETKGPGDWPEPLRLSPLGPCPGAPLQRVVGVRVPGLRKEDGEGVARGLSVGEAAQTDQEARHLSWDPSPHQRGSLSTRGCPPVPRCGVSPPLLHKTAQRTTSLQGGHMGPFPLGCSPSQHLSLGSPEKGNRDGCSGADPRKRWGAGEQGEPQSLRNHPRRAARHPQLPSPLGRGPPQFQAAATAPTAWSVRRSSTRLAELSRPIAGAGAAVRGSGVTWAPEASSAAAGHRPCPYQPDPPALSQPGSPGPDREQGGLGETIPVWRLNPSEHYTAHGSGHRAEAQSKWVLVKKGRGPEVSGAGQGRLRMHHPVLQLPQH